MSYNQRQRNAVIAVARDVCNKSYGELSLELYIQLQEALDELDRSTIEQAWNPKPIGPPNRILRETDHGPYCDECGSSFKPKYIFWKHDHCIQPKCKNYYE